MNSKTCERCGESMCSGSIYCTRCGSGQCHVIGPVDKPADIYDDDAPGERLARMMHHAEELAQYARETADTVGYNQQTRMALVQLANGINAAMERLYSVQDMVTR